MSKTKKPEFAKPYKIVDAIEDLKRMAVEFGNLEIMLLNFVDEDLLYQRDFRFEYVELEAETGEVMKICAFARDLDEHSEPIDERKIKNETMN